MSAKQPLKIPRVILEEMTKEVRIVLPDETRGLFPLPIDLLKNEAFVRNLADKEFQANFDVAIISKGR